MANIYENKYNDLLSSALAELTTKTDITQLGPGTKARTLIEVVMREISNTYTQLNIELANVFVSSASGKNLDFIGELVGLTRWRANRNVSLAEAKVQKFYVEDGIFGGINDGYSFTIPKGTRVYTRQTSPQELPVEYILTADVFCDLSLSEVYASIKSVEFGGASNIGAGSLVVHDFSVYSDYLNGTLKTINIDSIIQAINDESDETFRYRISSQALSGESANATAIRLAALSVPGVSDVILEEYTRGIGTGSVYLKSVVPVVSESLKVAVQDMVNQVAAYGNLIQVRSPSMIGIEIDLTLNLYRRLPVLEETTLKNRVRDALYRYFNNFDINQSLEPSEIVRVVLGVDSNIKSTGSLVKQIDRLYVWKDSPAENSRMCREVLEGYVTKNFERITVEYTVEDPIRIGVAR